MSLARLTSFPDLASLPSSLRADCLAPLGTRIYPRDLAVNKPSCGPDPCARKRQQDGAFPRKQSSHVPLLWDVLREADMYCLRLGWPPALALVRQDVLAATSTGRSPSPPSSTTLKREHSWFDRGITSKKSCSFERCDPDAPSRVCRAGVRLRHLPSSRYGGKIRGAPSAMLLTLATLRQVLLCLLQLLVDSLPFSAEPHSSWSIL